jgi:hypothetical protein
MPLVQPMPFVRSQWFDDNGDPVANGFLYSYAAGTNTPLATYNDHTGSPGALNPNPVLLDSGGYADVWLTSSSYKLVLQDANHIQLWSIDGVPGLGSLISVGDLPPLFTSVFAAGGLSFNLDNAAANTLFGRFAGTTGAPSYGAVGSDQQIVFNETGGMVGQNNLKWDYTNWRLKVVNGANNAFATLGPGSIGFATGGNPNTPPRISTLFTVFDMTSAVGQDINIGQSGNNDRFVLPASDLGTILLGTGASHGSVFLNDGTSLAGSRAGARIIMGSIATPEGIVSAETGSLFLTTNGGAGTTLWVKESSPTVNTGWIGK